MQAAIHIPAPRTLAWASAAAVLAVACAALLLRLAAEGPSPWETEFAPMAIAGALTFGLPGALAAAHAPRNAVGWLMVAIGLCLGIAQLCGEWADRTLRVEPGVLPAGEAALWVSQWLWVPAFGLVPTLLLLLFPDGRLPEPRWWPVAAAGAAGVAITTLWWATTPYADLDVPPPYPGTESLLASDDVSAALASGGVLLVAAAAGSLASLVVRLRRSSGLEHRQVQRRARCHARRRRAGARGAARLAARRRRRAARRRDRPRPGERRGSCTTCGRLRSTTSGSRALSRARPRRSRRSTCASTLRSRRTSCRRRSRSRPTGSSARRSPTPPATPVRGRPR